MPIALAARGELECWAGRWAAAEADATESLRWAEELGHPGAIGYSMACLARLDALRGDRARCEDRIAKARRETGPYRIGSLETYFTWILGLSALAFGEYDVAVTHLQQIFEIVLDQQVGNPRVVPFVADLIEAQVRAGRPELADPALSWLHKGAERTGLSWPAAALSRCRGMLADTPEQAEKHFTTAVEIHQRQNYPFELARTLMCQGESLRRFRCPGKARAPLASAHACFESLVPARGHGDPLPSSRPPGNGAFQAPADRAAAPVAPGDPGGSPAILD